MSSGFCGFVILNLHKSLHISRFSWLVYLIRSSWISPWPESYFSIDSGPWYKFDLWWTKTISLGLFQRSRWNFTRRTKIFLERRDFVWICRSDRTIRRQWMRIPRCFVNCRWARGPRQSDTERIASSFAQQSVQEVDWILWSSSRTENNKSQDDWTWQSSPEKYLCNSMFPCSFLC